MIEEYFESFAKASSGRCATTLLRARTVKLEQIFTTVHGELAYAVPHMVEGGKYKIAMLCDPVVWAEWGTLEHRVAGMCVAFFKRNRVFQLYRHVTPKGKGTALYRTSPTPKPVKLKTTAVAYTEPSGYVLKLKGKGLSCR